MTLLANEDTLRERAAVAKNELASLAEGLSAEFEPLKEHELYVPREKALLSREGGRCPRDGSILEFDPFSPHGHRCPTCGTTYTGELHDRFWIFWYQLWLAERAVHGALLGGLLGDQSASAVATSILEHYADQYSLYPNRDNVLGPTRVFFSTYLESIWLLNLCVALDLLERASPGAKGLGARVRDRIIEPSVAVIAAYDEGGSNRQVWNDAALFAAARLLGSDDLAERALFGPSGAVFHLENGLLPDGTWYEGENYHLFAHRGLWYSVTMAEAARITLPSGALARFQEGFVTPFLTSLPDMTLPSRRDSQYAISLRQPRFAELCELGLAREPGQGDPRLRGMLHRLYEDDYPRRDVGRANSTADVERNLPGTCLSRADLGWRSLLFARTTLPPLLEKPLGTVLLEAQGIAVFRRAHEQVYMALDYGSSGGGHGHPDRLNVLLSHGDTRWLDDMGTGSYVDPSLHWYRSTLAHNAPMFDGRDQARVDGELLGFDAQPLAGWASGRVVELAPGVTATRSLVVASDYVLDEVAWESEHPAVLHLPMHVDPSELSGLGAALPEDAASRIPDPLGVLRDVSGHAVEGQGIVRMLARRDGRALLGFLASSLGAELYRATAPGAPGTGRQGFIILRVAAPAGRHWVRTVWNWSESIASVTIDDDGALTTVRRVDGSAEQHGRVDTGPERAPVVVRTRSAPRHPTYEVVSCRPLVIDLGGESYRRSEESWVEAGRPTARVTLLVEPNELRIDVAVRKSGDLTFVQANAVNWYDNESPDINGDGMQLYVHDGLGSSAWILIPETGPDQSRVRTRMIDEWPVARPLQASWRRTDVGYALSARLPIALIAPDHELALGVVVNEKPPNRERRRGQLVLGGAGGEFVYLRGDREALDRLPRFRVTE